MNGGRRSGREREILGGEGVAFALRRMPGRRRCSVWRDGETRQPDPAAASAVVGVNDAAERGGESQGARGGQAERKSSRGGEGRHDRGQREGE